ncbi:MAG: ThuA domain-containing protein [Verrucomicrobiae bacterium]|nr:ThuA domain-containing protein [Verrucomicrobiae bacterium]MCP5539470.1 ThuA domain-containing protein [Akkermansiaceae bacterium]MCP5551710.1 ThuA domain-containing protein [Akkermansiaceae bacterium]
MPISTLFRALSPGIGLTFLLATSSGAAEKLRVLLVDGQNNHAWQQTTPVLKAVLESSGRFEVEVSTSPPAPPRGPGKPKGDDPAAKAAFEKAMRAWVAETEQLKQENQAKWDAWRPDFAAHDVVVSNYNGEPWPAEVEKALEAYVSGGGGFVSVHAANNSFPQWRAYNAMIGVGGWGGRNELSGPYLRLRDGKFVRDTTPGRGGSHGAKHEFLVTIRDPGHPIVKGLPAAWRHATDELYDRLRGPAENVTVLATAFADPEKGGSGEDEPMLMTIEFGKGRVFHTTLGHDTAAMSGVGFQETLKRGVEWAATGGVTFGPVSASELPAEGEAAKRETPAAPNASN